jgi:hypothetical protein
MITALRRPNLSPQVDLIQLFIHLVILSGLESITNIGRGRTIRTLMHDQMGDILETLSHIMEEAFSICWGFQAVSLRLEMEMPTSANN